MRVAICNDSHFGARSDSQTFLRYFISFFEEQFFPYLEEHDIKHVIHLGDLMDRRKFVNFNTLNQVRQQVFDRLNKMGVEFHCLIGNHDTYYRNTNEVNSIRELFADRYDNFYLYDTPTQIKFGECTFDMIPWINKENIDEVNKYIVASNSNICCGHFELNGYEVMRGVKFEGGMEDNILKKYEMVLSGHFHSKQTKNNVYYLGTQYQITFSDLHEKKGFHVFDTSDHSIEFIENPNRMFHAVYWDDTEPQVAEDLINSDLSKYTQTYVKIFIKNKKNAYQFDRFLDKLYENSVANITIVEEVLIDDDDGVMIDLAQDTLTLINNEIDSMDDVEDKGRLKTIVRELYFEALSQ